MKEVDFNVKEDIVYDTDSTGPSPFGLKPSQIRGNAIALYALWFCS